MTNANLKAGVGFGPVPDGPVMDEPMVLIDAALNGQAVVLAPPALFQDYINAGLLTAPVGDKIKKPIDYFLMLPADREVTSGVRKFVKWVRSQSIEMNRDRPFEQTFIFLAPPPALVPKCRAFLECPHCASSTAAFNNDLEVRFGPSM